MNPGIGCGLYIWVCLAQYNTVAQGKKHGGGNLMDFETSTLNSHQNENNIRPLGVWFRRRFSPFPKTGMAYP